MAYKALYRTYRPISFEEVVGQQHIVKTLQNAIVQNKIAHAYLFCGPRGTGKTTVAKLVAKAVNCRMENPPCNQCDSCKSIQLSTHPDIVEIDAASNNGVDEIRDLIEKVKYSPIEGKYKVYIIDEVHMLSQGAFNALLKTLEEPPEHVIFILATTEPHKVLPTIISRCQRFDFTKVPTTEIAQRVEDVLVNEGIDFQPEVVRLVATLAEGGLRDALSILEQCIAYGQDHLEVKHVYDIYGITTVQEKLELLLAVFDQNAKTILDKVRFISEKSFDIKRLTADLIELLKECVIYQYTKDESLLQTASASEVNQLLEHCDASCALRMIDVLIETMEKYRNATNIHAYFEIALLKMMNLTEIQEIALRVHTDVKPVVSQEVIKHETDTKKETLKSHVKEELLSQDEVIDDNEEITLPLKDAVVESQSTQVGHVTQLDDLTIIRYMVGADKETKIEDESKWGRYKEYLHDLAWTKIVRYMDSSEVFVSSKNYIVIAVPYEENANMINDELHKDQLLQFTKEILSVSKQVIAISSAQKERVRQEYIQRHKNGSLPAAIEVKIVQQEVVEVDANKKETIEEQLLDLFGNHLEIVEE